MQVMLQSSPPTEADRIALTNMFRAIAEYGRRIRQRGETEGQKDVRVEFTEPKHDPDGQLPSQQTKAMPNE
ncbi:MAG: hypothetical protein HY865_24685 [Chloroflexi bacterium]|nr:hypothetical protein [Chloroflexota bacterium]